jgi:phosphoribosyl 1,2-cyclic phosphodiesterase
VSTGKTRILVDAGLSRKETFARLAAIDEDPSQLDALVITHEHSDHVCGLVPLARALRIPVFLTHLTAPLIDWNGFEARVETFQAGTSIPIGDLTLDSFTIPHDAVDPVGFVVKGNGVKAAIVTDLGYLPDSVRWHIRSADVLILEANHDLEMLKVGPYPWSVKQRVMGRRGHLSNDVVSQYIAEDLDSSTSLLVLGHLSESNNHPEIVRLVASQALGQRSFGTRLVVAEPRRASEVFLY